LLVSVNPFPSLLAKPEKLSPPSSAEPKEIFNVTSAEYNFKENTANAGIRHRHVMDGFRFFMGIN